MLLLRKLFFQSCQSVNETNDILARSYRAHEPRLALIFYYLRKRKKQNVLPKDDLNYQDIYS